MISVKNVSKKYHKKSPYIIRDVSFEIREGEAIGLVGANGSGKSTLVEMIAGVNDVTSGKIVMNNNSENKDNLQKHIGIQFQNGKWPFNTRPVDLLTFFVGKNWKNDFYIKNLIEIFEVSNILKLKLSNCSGGEQQRFNCMLSVISKPKLLILDELITGLDLKMQIKLINFFDNLRRTEKITLIIISHIPEEIEQICDRIIVLKNGSIFNDTSVKSILDKYGSVRKYLINFFEEGN